MLTDFIDWIGDETALTLAGLMVGLLFGATAQQSRFCLRAATVEVADGKLGPSLAIWLLAFGVAVATVQGAALTGWFDAEEARQIASPGSISGAILGGLMFGAGMVLARGCASRLLVLASTGNLRALVSGLVLTLVAQAALRGALSPAREELSALWIIEGGAARDLLAITGIPQWLVFASGCAVLVATLYWATRTQGQSLTRCGAAMGVGIAVALGWVATYQLSQILFIPVPVASITFTGPSTDTLMGLVNTSRLPLSFGFGLVPGVAIAACATAVLTGTWQVQRFGPDTPMERYLIGASLMGFGAMLAGGCAVGAGMSGGAVFSLTAWVAVGSMWIGAMLTRRLMQRKGTPQIA